MTAPAPHPPRRAATGQLTPRATPTGPAWEATTTRTCARAIAAAIPGTTTRTTSDRRCAALIPHPAITVTICATTGDAITCQLTSAPEAGPLTLTYHPWTPADILTTPPPPLPATGTLTIREIRLTTLMGTTIRYLIPAFTTRP
jgi:hypothetical protein